MTASPHLVAASSLLVDAMSIGAEIAGGPDVTRYEGFVKSYAPPHFGEEK
jgi:hypothetical protein